MLEKDIVKGLSKRLQEDVVLPAVYSLSNTIRNDILRTRIPNIIITLMIPEIMELI